MLCSYFLYLICSFILLLIVVSFCFIFLFSINFTRRHPEPRIPPDSRSVQILYRISGMLNESNRCIHRWWYVSCIYYIGTNGNRKCQANFYEWLNYKKFSLAVSPHHLAKCVICIFAKFVCFSRICENTKTRKMTFFTHLQNSEK